MTGLKYVTLGILATAMAVAMSGNLAAQDRAALVKERIDIMRQMGKAFRPVMPIVKGESSKVEDALSSAMTWNRLASNLLAKFPAGTGRDAVPESRAKPEVWSNRAEFEAAAKRFMDESGKLVAAAKANDVEAFRAQFKAFGSACGGCHKGKGKAGGKFRFAKE